MVKYILILFLLCVSLFAQPKLDVSVKGQCVTISVNTSEMVYIKIWTGDRCVYGLENNEHTIIEKVLKPGKYFVEITINRKLITRKEFEIK